MEDQPRPYLKWVLWGIGALIALALLVVAIKLLLPREPTPVPVQPTLPSASSTGPGTAGGAGTLTVAAKLGPVTVTDFLHNGITGSDPQNQDMYYLAGAPGYCLTDGTCPHGAKTNDFNITYDAAHQFFTIALLSEPLGKARTGAEQFLLNALGISETKLCTLNYYLGTVSALNDRYAGKNLGFSFCPNATVLP